LCPRVSPPPTTSTPTGSSPHALPPASPDGCLVVLRQMAAEHRTPPPGQLVVCKVEEDVSVRDLVSRELQPHSSDPGLTVPVIRDGCRLERVCGTVAGVDCDAAADGPYYYYDMTDWRSLATCGGACMAGRCVDCPPKEFRCAPY